MEKLQDKLMQFFADMDEVYEEYAKAKGMNYVSLVILEEIFESGEGCTQKQISEATRYPKQTVNLVVKSFIEDGYVELVEDALNRRNKQIVLTDKGRTYCNGIVLPLLEKENSVMKDMGDEASSELIRLLELYSRLYCDKINEIK